MHHLSEFDRVFKEYAQLQRDIAAKHHIDAKDIVSIVVVNWVAPCTIKSEMLDLQANCIATVASLTDKCIIPILFPQFSYKRGQLYLSDRMIMDMLAQRGLNFDHKFGLLFSDRPDSRDTRCLIYDGRIVTPFDMKESEYIFRNCELMKGRTEPAMMLKSSLLQSIEDTSEEALPSTTDVDGCVKGAAKFAQVGPDGMEKLLDAILGGISLDNRSAVIFWELNAGWGNLFDAYLTKRLGWNFPAYYFTSTDDSVLYEWLLHNKKDTIKAMHLEGKLEVPGFSILPAKMPESLLEDPPAVPTMNRLVAIPVKRDEGSTMKVAMREDLIKTWYAHNLFGDEFKARSSRTCRIVGGGIFAMACTRKSTSFARVCAA